MTVSLAPRLHAADCGVWDGPRTSDVDRLLGRLAVSEAAAVYLTEIAPVYHGLSRILAQLSGVLLLAMTGGKPSLSLDHVIWSDAKSSLDEAQERLQAIKAPPAASAHLEALNALAAHLAAAATAIEIAAPAIAAPLRRQRLEGALRELHAAQKRLIAAALPDADITPVDLSHACCNCGAIRRPQFA